MEEKVSSIARRIMAGDLTVIVAPAEATAFPTLNPQEANLADALVANAQKYGKFEENGRGIWAGYDSPVENGVKNIGVKCSNCALYEGVNSCKIIAMAVEPEGKCRFAVIPDGVVTKS
jgi:hypothetical protein